MAKTKSRGRLMLDLLQNEISSPEVLREPKGKTISIFHTCLMSVIPILVRYNLLRIYDKSRPDDT